MNDNGYERERGVLLDSGYGFELRWHELPDGRGILARWDTSKSDASVWYSMPLQVSTGARVKLRDLLNGSVSE